LAGNDRMMVGSKPRYNTITPTDIYVEK